MDSNAPQPAAPPALSSEQAQCANLLIDLLLEVLQPQAQGAAAPSAQARQQAGAVIEQGKQRADASVRATLQSVLQQASQASAPSKGDQAILQRVQGAQSLGDLRPSVLPPGGQAAPGQIVLAQVAEQLINLIKEEVQRSLAPLQQELPPALATLQQQLQGQAGTIAELQQQLQQLGSTVAGSLQPELAAVVASLQQQANTAATPAANDSQPAADGV